MLMLQIRDRSLAMLIVMAICMMQGQWQQSAQAESADILRFQHLGPDDGLASNYIPGTLRDSRGFLWLATLDGLSRYDGIDVMTYRHEPNNPNSLSSSDISTLAEDAEGNLWVGTRGDGLNRFDFAAERFTRYQHDPANSASLSHNTVKALHVDAQQRLWVTTQRGLSRLNPGSKAFINYLHDPANPDSISSNAVTYSCSDQAGRLWVSTSNAGLTQLDPASGKFQHYPINPFDSNSPLSNNVRTLHCAPNGMLWISTYSGLSRLDPDTGQFKHYLHDPNDPGSYGGSVAASIITDSRGQMWIAMGSRGLSRFDPVSEQFTHYRYDPRDPRSLSSNYALHVQEDNSGILWVGSYDKVSYTSLASPRFTNYVYNPLLPNNLSYPSVTSVASSSSDNAIWLGLLDGGLNRLTRDTGEIKHYRHDPDNPETVSNSRVMAVRLDKDGILWLGTGDGLNRFDPATERFTRYFVSPGKNNTDVHCLDTDSQGRVWFTGLHMRGLYRFDPRLVTSDDALREMDPRTEIMPPSLYSYRYGIDHVNTLTSTLLNSLIVDKQDNVWLGSQDDGIFHLDTRKDRFTHYYADGQPGSLSGNKTTMVYEANDGTIWVATSTGLNRLDAKTGRFKVYQTADGLPGNDVVSIIEDLQGNLWLGTTKGLARFDPVSEAFRTFDKFDGLQSNIFYWRSAARAPDGQLLFGGRKGLSAFYPEQLSSNPYKPPVFITDFQLFNQSVPVGDDSPLQRAIGTTQKLTLTHEQSVFSFKFAALNLLYPLKNRYAYKLHGFDSEWNYTDSHERSATYTNLDAGQYIFQVKGSNNDGVWNEDGVSVELTILPPWWETWWFRVCVLAVLVLLIFTGVRWRLHAMAVQQRRLETQVKERTRELDIANRAISELNEQLKGENIRMGAELDVSKRMQKMLLPSPEELSEIKDLDIAVFMEPADEVGGDYYDVMVENERVTIAIGDVTGHGLESGVMMILVQAGVHTLLADGVHEPGHFINTLNRMVHGNAKRMDTDKNLTLMLLDYQDGQVCFSGQHEELLWISQAGHVQRIDTFDLGFMVGVEHNIEHLTTHQERELLPGEGIVLYTDGITEAMNAAQKQYGVDRLCDVINRHWHEPADKIQQAVIQDVLRHLDAEKPMDDLTLVVVKRREVVEAAVSLQDAAAG